MSRRTFKKFSFVALFALAAILCDAGQALAAGPAEGSFEAGNFAAWSPSSFYGRNLWAAEPRAQAEADFETPMPAEVGPYVAATAYNGTDTSFLSQTFALPAASSLRLSLYLFAKSETPTAVPNPDTLFVKDLEGEPGGDQQVRVDVLRPNAPLESLSPNDILATLYASPNGGPARLVPTLVSADLTAFAGQTVTLRVAAAVSNGPMIAGVGDVSLAATPLPPPLAVESIAAPLPAPVAGRLTRNRRSGAGRLTVTVPAAGQLTVSDARRKVAVASTFSSGPRAAPGAKPILIRTASAQTEAAQMVRVPLRPTAAAKKLLAKNGRLPFRLQLSFTATDGTVSTATYKGTLVRRPRPAPG